MILPGTATTMDETEESSVGHLEDEALKRRRMIEELRNKRKQAHSDNQQEQIGQDKVQLPKPKFRSYNPSDESLKENALPKARPENVQDQLMDDLEKGKLSEALMDDIDLTKLAPRKIDWDLKRNIAKKLDKLEKRTQVAIAELIRERLKLSGIDNLDQATEDLDSANKQAYDEDDD